MIGIDLHGQYKICTADCEPKYKTWTKHYGLDIKRGLGIKCGLRTKCDLPNQLQSIFLLTSRNITAVKLHNTCINENKPFHMHMRKFVLLYTYRDLRAKKHRDKNRFFGLEKPADWSHDFFH